MGISQAQAQLDSKFLQDLENVELASIGSYQNLPQDSKSLHSNVAKGLSNIAFLGISGSGKSFAFDHIASVLTGVSETIKPKLISCLLYTSPSPRDS